MNSLQLHPFDYFKGRQHTETETSDQLLTVHLGSKQCQSDLKCAGAKVLCFVRVYTACTIPFPS